MSISDHQTHAGTRSATFLPTKRFYRFIRSISAAIALAEDHECESDSAALALGKSLLSEKRCPQLEVWLDRTRIGVMESRSRLGL